MKAETVFSVVWLAVWAWLYRGIVWGTFAESHYNRTPRLFRTVIPGREADMRTYVAFQQALMKVLGPIGFVFGVLLLVGSLIGK